MKKIFGLLVAAMMVMVSCGVTPVEPEIPVEDTFYVGEANGFGGGQMSDTTDLAYLDFMKDSLVFRFYYNMIDGNIDWLMGGVIETDTLIPYNNMKFVANGDTTVLTEAKLIYQLVESDSTDFHLYTLISGIGDTIWQYFPWMEDGSNDWITCCRPHDKEKEEGEE